MSSDDDRVAYLAGDGTEAPFFPEGADDLDELRGLLADATLWDDPPARLEDDVVAAVTAAAAEAPPEPVTDVPFPRTDELPVVPDAPAPGTAPLAGAAPAGPAAAPGGDRPATGAAPVSATAAPGTAGAGPASLDERRRRRRAWPAALASAVAAAAAVLIGVVVVSDTGGDEGPSATFEAALAATDLAPGAGGTVSAARFDSGWRLELDATGLPRLADGEFYEAWLLGPGDVLVPVGTFNEGADVVLWAGVSPADFTAFTVTRETADGDQASSGQRVLSGPLEPTDG